MVRPRWIYHLVLRADLPGGDLAPASLAREGFIHGSFRDDVAESARLYFPAGADLVALPIDPRRVAVRVELAPTPRGPMPHIADGGQCSRCQLSRGQSRLENVTVDRHGQGATHLHDVVRQRGPIGP